MLRLVHCTVLYAALHILLRQCRPNLDCWAKKHLMSALISGAGTVSSASSQATAPLQRHRGGRRPSSRLGRRRGTRRNNAAPVDCNKGASPAWAKLLSLRPWWVWNPAEQDERTEERYGLIRGPLTLCPTSTARVKQLPFWRSASPFHNDDFLTLRLRLLSCCPLEWDMQPAAICLPESDRRNQVLQR